MACLIKVNNIIIYPLNCEKKIDHPESTLIYMYIMYPGCVDQCLPKKLAISLNLNYVRK
jgi:hypothetical protein